MPSGVIGKVTLLPTCPGPQRPGQSCAKPFIGADVQLLDAFGRIVMKTTTDARGLFVTDAPAGEYTLQIDTLRRFPPCPEMPLTVPKEGRAFVQIHCDTGLR